MDDTENSPELMLAPEFKIKRTIDPHLCSLQLRPKTNNPTEGYDLEIRANFGCESVPINTRGESIEFSFEIYKAEIIFHSYNCKLSENHKLKFPMRIPAVPDELLKSEPGKKTSKYFVKADDVIAGFGGGYETVIEEGINDDQQAWYEVNWIDDGIIGIESKGRDALPINGTVLDHITAYHVIPDEQRDSAILARIRVREDWIRLARPRAVGHVGKIYKQISDLLTNEHTANNRRKRAFHILLTHLIGIGLQKTSNTRDATLAFDSVAVRYIEETFGRLSRDDRQPMLEIEGDVIRKFFRTKIGSEKSVLINAGVSAGRLAGLDDYQDSIYSNGNMNDEGSKTLAAKNKRKAAKPVNETIFLKRYFSNMDTVHIQKNYDFDQIRNIIQESIFRTNILHKNDIEKSNIILNSRESLKFLSKNSVRNNRRIKRDIKNQEKNSNGSVFFNFHNLFYISYGNVNFILGNNSLIDDELFLFLKSIYK